MELGDTNGRSTGAGNREEANWAPLEVAGLLSAGEGCDPSNLVMVRPVGIFPEPLCFRRLLEGPGLSDGDACLDKLRGVRDVEVDAVDVPLLWGIAYAPGVMGNCWEA
jgi:hypothetical protein